MIKKAYSEGNTNSLPEWLSYILDTNLLQRQGEGKSVSEFIENDGALILEVLKVRAIFRIKSVDSEITGEETNAKR